MDVQTEEQPENAPETAPVDALIAGKSPETVNLVANIPEDKLKKIADRVRKDYDTDFKSSERWREKHASILKLFIGMLPPSQTDGAQVHYGIVAKASIRTQARVYDQQFPSNGEVFGVKATDGLDLPRALRLTKHLNWQVAHQIPEYIPNHDDLIMQWVLYGSAFSYVYWSEAKQRICHEACRTEDIILPYKRKSEDPSLGDMPRITRVIRPQRHELEADAESGYYDQVAVDKLFEKMDDGEAGRSMGEDSQKSSSITEVIDRASGVEKPEDGEDDSIRVLLEQHRWLKLPDEKKARPVIVTIDRETKIVLSIRLREDEDPNDRARYNREQQANEAAYAAAMQQYAMDLAQYEQNQTQMPQMGEATMTVPPMMGESTSTLPMMPAVPPPTPPEMPPPPAPVRMIPVNFFTHYKCIPNPEGVYGFGIGFLLEGPNMVADTTASQMVDAGNLSLSRTFVYSRQAKLSRGEFRLRIGEGTQTDLSPQDLDKGFKFLDFKPPNPALANFINDQKQEGDDISGAGDILSGEVGGSNETATTTQIRISQALQAISIENKRYSRARTEELRKIARLNSVYLSDEEYFTVVDPMKAIPPQQPGGQMMPVVERMQVSRMDYLEDTDITYTADPRMASQPQRVAEALQALQTAASIPILAMNPVLMTELARDYYKALDKPNLVAALGMAPPPMMPPGAPTPGQEGGKSNGGPPKPGNPGPRVPNAGPTPANQSDTSAGATA